MEKYSKHMLKTWCIHTHRFSFRSPVTFGSFRPRWSWPVILWKTRYEHLAWKIQRYKWLYQFNSLTEFSIIYNNAPPPDF